MVASTLPAPTNQGSKRCSEQGEAPSMPETTMGVFTKVYVRFPESIRSGE